MTVTAAAAAATVTVTVMVTNNSQSPLSLFYPIAYLPLFPPLWNGQPGALTRFTARGEEALAKIGTLRSKTAHPST